MSNNGLYVLCLHENLIKFLFMLPPRMSLYGIINPAVTMTSRKGIKVASTNKSGEILNSCPSSAMIPWSKISLDSEYVGYIILRAISMLVTAFVFLLC